MEKIAESEKVWKNGVAEGEILYYWQSDTYRPLDYWNEEVIKKYAKEHDVILVIDLTVGWGGYSQLYEHCKGFIMNDFPFSENHAPNPNIIPHIKDKPIAVIDYAMGLHRKELKRVPYEEREKLFEEFPDNLKYAVNKIEGKKYAVMVDDKSLSIDEVIYSKERALLKEGQKIRLECKNGKCEVYEI